MFTVALGHMLGLSGVAAFVWRAQVAGHALVGVETLDGLRRQPHFELMRHQLVWHLVEVTVDLDVVVDVDSHLFAILRTDRPTSNFRRSTSRILRMDIRSTTTSSLREKRPMVVNNPALLPA